ncbi:DUF2339 domain-containing protein [Bacteroidales bacterium OttesenSCG-928-I21]|nr:DUF2339 domain-containing protein [Bacteroidales bacterium OttesenSCG-928-I21]
MTEIKNKIEKLEEKLRIIISEQNSFAKEIKDLQNEISELKKDVIIQEASIPIRETTQSEPAEKPKETETYKPAEAETEEPEIRERVTPPPFVPHPTPKTEEIKEKKNLEKYIGENLISKIGIIITVIGAAFGVKYSIDNQLVSPVVRIILGYLLGFGLLAFGIKLKEKYENYSAVLVSGACAIMYFITFAGYSFYDLLPLPIAFVLMLVFTVFTVIAAIHYNKQVIAQIGLVGAYAVPFLLSDGSGRIAVLFSYMAVINVGILIIAYKKYWKSIYYSSFALTWIIFSGWYLIQYNSLNHFDLCIIFLCVFFFIFYSVFLVYKLVQKEKYTHWDIIPLLINSFLFYGIGYSVFASHKTGMQYLGLFTLANAVIHFVVGVIIHKQKLADKNLLYLVVSLVFVFITMAIPVQLDGNWVTLIWLSEACVLFVFGTIKSVPIFKKISYVLVLLAFLSLLQDWNVTYGFNLHKYGSTKGITPVFNVQFLTSIFACTAFGIICCFHFGKKYSSTFYLPEEYRKFMNCCLSGILLVTTYFAFWLEISNYWTQLDSIHYIENSTYYLDIAEYKKIWSVNYSLIFVCVLSIINFVKIKNKTFGIFTIVLSIFFIFIFLTSGLYALSELRENYLTQQPNDFHQRTLWNIVIRYISLAFVALCIGCMYWQIKQRYMRPFAAKLRLCFDVVLHVSIWWILSSELINWIDISGSDRKYELGLSILWGIYALMLIILGIWKQKRHFRIGGIVLFAITLLKLFFYDLRNLDTISKTIILVILGILLLIVSFLYNKYKHLIYEDTENEEFH